MNENFMDKDINTEEDFISGQWLFLSTSQCSKIYLVRLRGALKYKIRSRWEKKIIVGIQNGAWNWPKQTFILVLHEINVDL